MQKIRNPGAANPIAHETTIAHAGYEATLRQTSKVVRDVGLCQGRAPDDLVNDQRPGAQSIQDRQPALVRDAAKELRPPLGGRRDGIAVRGDLFHIILR